MDLPNKAESATEKQKVITLEVKFISNINAITRKKAGGRNVDIVSIWRDPRCAMHKPGEGEFTDK